MEIRCEKCSHIGPAASMDAADEGVMLTCENCGHQNLLSAGADPVGSEVAGGPAKTPTPRPGGGSAMGVWLRKDAFQALVPTPGKGARCLKCAHLLAMDLSQTPDEQQNCSRCGLNQAEAAHYAPGEGPWEQPLSGKEAQTEQADLLWAAIENTSGPETAPGAENPKFDEKLENFVRFVVDEDLLELGIRKLRHHLVAHPDDKAATAQLRELAESMQSRVIVATARARADADQFEQEVDRYRNRFITVGIIMLVICLILFIVVYLD